MSAFTVVEAEKGRRRAIHWPEEINAAVKQRYKAQIPIGHISEYLHIAQAASGGTLDLRCGFWQIAIPQTARSFYRFRDAAGTLFEMNRLMMGHVVSCELMQILTGVIVGDQTVVQRQHAAKTPAKVWIDGVCFYGNRDDVADSLARAKRAAVDLRSEFKDPDSSPTTEYDFIGVRWNHRDGTVRLADKTWSKLPATVPEAFTARDVEQLVGRLIFASAVVQSPLVEHYFAMKWAKRVCNALNSGKIDPSSSIAVAPGTAKQLRAWLTQARTVTKPRFVRDGVRPVLFTDATLENYGGVLVLPTQQVLVTGAAFSDKEQPIAVREAQAVLYSIQDFERHLRGKPGVDVRVDNTTIEFSLRRGGARTDVLATVLQSVLRKSIDLDLPLTVSRIASVDNPADEPSRRLVLDEAKLAAALAIRAPQYERRGAGRTFV